MRRFLKISIRMLSAMAGLFLLAFIIFLIFLTVTRYHPARVEQLVMKGKQSQSILNNDTFTFMSWNIGYAGLGREMDFFYEGGRRVKPEKEEFRKDLQGILRTIGSNDTLDFIFIQEADINSKRSHYTDEASELAKILSDHCFAFAKNYDCRYVPVPMYDPMG